jgi:hypothetical protein
MLSNPLEMKRLSIITTTPLQKAIYPPERSDRVVISSVFYPRLAVWLDAPASPLATISTRKCPVRLLVLLFRPENPSQNGLLAESPRYSKTPRRLDPSLYIAPPMVFSARPWPNALLHNEMCRLNNTPCLSRSLVNNRLFTLHQTPCCTALNLPLSAATISPYYS